MRRPPREFGDGAAPRPGTVQAGEGLVDRTGLAVIQVVHRHKINSSPVSDTLAGPLIGTTPTRHHRQAGAVVVTVRGTFTTPDQ